MPKKPLKVQKQAPKLFVVRKYIKATSAAEAIRKDKSTPPDDVWVDEKWKEGQGVQLAEAIGFKTTTERDYD